MKNYRMGLILAGSISLDSPFNQCAFKSFTTCAFRVRREFSKPRQWDHHFSHEKICSSGFEKIHPGCVAGKRFWRATTATCWRTSRHWSLCARTVPTPSSTASQSTSRSTTPTGLHPNLNEFSSVRMSTASVWMSSAFVWMSSVSVWMSSVEVE